MSAVVVYHLYPKLLPGGFVGVDIFFVISGFLITGHLAGNFAEHGRVRVLEFYGRRARRLLPAAVLVLTVTWFAARAVLPSTQLPDTATQIRASALYVQNWVLAHNSVDYLKIDAAATPVQHYWSLSVEEQFYLFWPVLFLIAFAVSRLLGRTWGLRAATSVAVVVVAASLAYSIQETRIDPASAYFVTTTRVWELGLGGLLALLARPAARVLRRIGLIAWIGLAMIVWSLFELSGSSAFPGSIALVPVGGAMLMIASGGRGARLGPAPLTTLRPMVFLGDISYSLYLWHFPIIVLWKAYSGPTIGIWDGAALVAASILLAWLTKVLVEDPVRLTSIIARSPIRSISLVLSAVIPVTIVSIFLTGVSTSVHTRPDARHPGAAVLAGDATAAQNVQLIPPVNAAQFDLAIANRSGCKTLTFDTTIVSCTVGDTVDPVRTIALVGDSYAGEWSSALDLIGKRRHWKVVTLIHDGCPWTAVVTTNELAENRPFTQCHAWGRAVLRRIVTTIKPDAVITSFRPGPGIPGHVAVNDASQHAIADGMITYWHALARAGVHVIGIEPTPDPEFSVADCLASRTGSVDACSFARAKAELPQTAIDRAVTALGPAEASLINLDPLICGSALCRPEVGNVIVYRDALHVGKTYSLSLAPYLGADLARTSALRAGT